MAELHVDTREIAEKVATGEYYEEAKGWYSTLYHNPIPERCYFIVVTVLAIITTWFAVSSFSALQPIKPHVPFVIVSKDVFNEIPSIRQLALPRETPDSALMRFLVENYVIQREEYDLDHYGRNTAGVRGQSDETTYADYQRLMDPQNPLSPLALYERHTRRLIWVRSTLVRAQQEPYTAEVRFVATTVHGKEVKKTDYVANITFRYTPIEVKKNEENGHMKVTPMRFLVTGYEVKEARATESQ